MKRKILSILLLVIAILALAGCGKKEEEKKENPKYRIQDYLSLEYSSKYNGYATPTLKKDTEKLNQLISIKNVGNYIMRIVKTNDELKDQYQAIGDKIKENPDRLPKFVDLFKISLKEEYKNLSNGDKVTVVVTVDEGFMEFTGDTLEKIAENLELNVESFEFELTVSGLEEAKAVDVDFSKVFKVDFGTYDGYSIPTIELDADYIDNLVISEVREKYRESDSLTSDAKWLLSRSSSNWFTVEFVDTYVNIKNGDKITAEIKLNKKLADEGLTLQDVVSGLMLNINDGKATFVVSGLEKPQNPIDVLEDIEAWLSYKGINGTGSIGNNDITVPDDYVKEIGDIKFVKGFYRNSLDVYHGEDNLGFISFHVTYTTNLTKGDWIKVTTSNFNFDKLENLGYVVPRKETMVQVPDLGKYVESKAEVTDEVLQAVKNRMSSGYIDIYYAEIKADVETEFKSRSVIAVLTEKTGWFGGYYFYICGDIIVRPDGTVIIEKTDDTSKEDTIEEAMLELEDYTIELLESYVPDEEVEGNN